MTTTTKWLDHHTWTCGRHLISGRFPHDRENCYLSTCKNYCGGRPEEACRPAPKERVLAVFSIEDPLACEWSPCKNRKRERSKYCSRTCSNKNARHRFRIKKVLMENSDDGTTRKTGT